MLFLKLIRTALRYKAQFISMILMVSIGIGCFVGFNMEWRSIEVNMNEIFDETGFADYRIYYNENDPFLFQEEDLESILSIDGVDMATRYFNINARLEKKDSKEKDSSVDLCVIEDYGKPTKLYVTEGEEYNSNSLGFYVSDKYAKAHNFKLGDTITLSYESYTITAPILSFVKSGEHLICITEDEIMPDYYAYGFIYMTPKKLKEVLGMELYSQIHVKSKLEAKEFKALVNDKISSKGLVIPKDVNVNYQETNGEMEEGKTMASVLPVLFLAIGILTMITTMHRVTRNEKTQIGTLKALGFKDRRILVHYTSYGLFIGIMGTILGIGIGFLLDYVIMNPNGFMGTYLDFIEWHMAIPFLVWPILLGILILLTFISFLSVLKMLKGTAADALRPYVPKKAHNLLIEKTKIWKKLSFSTKWNLRDIIRNKARTFMTLFGIFGATMLLVAAFGLKDTLQEYINTIDNKVYKYESVITVSSKVDNLAVYEYTESHHADYSSDLSIVIDDSDDVILFSIYNTSNSLYGFTDFNNNEVRLKNDGVYISSRVKNRGYSIGDTITIKPYGKNTSYKVKVIGYVTGFVAESITLSSEYANTLKDENGNPLSYQISSIYTSSSRDDILKENNMVVSSVKTKNEIINSFNSMMELMNTMVIVFVVLAIVLGIVVLYNLGIMSYVERYRELATLKVVGFKNKHISKILISQNVWLSILGVIIGIPSGIGVLELLMWLLGKDYEMNIVVGFMTYFISVVVTIGTSLFVSFILSLKNKHINMVEALKGVE